MKYSIGLDCGIASVGYAVMQLDENDEPCRIIDLGSRIFTKAENPKDGSSLALPRRDARGARRRLRRHQHRLDRIRYLIVQKNILSQDELDNLFKGQLSDIYMLRAKALDEPLNNKEFVRVLINLAQRRGFKSNRKSDAKDKEAGKLLQAVSENQKLMEIAGYRTVGEMLFKDEKYREYKRNKGEDYKNTVMRDMVEDEIHKIFLSQRAFGMDFATEEIEKDYTDIVMSQRPFDLGPGEGNANSPSIYSGDQIAKMIGKCTLFPDEQRAAKATYSFQIFTLWQNINNIKIASLNGTVRPLNDFERTEIYQLCHNTKDVNYIKIRKAIGLSDEWFFKNLSYGSKEKAEVEKTPFQYLKPFHQLKRVLDKNIKKDFIFTLSTEILDDIGYIFTVNKTDTSINDALKEKGIEQYIIDALSDLGSFAKFGHISVKACRMLIPFLEKGFTYDKACREAGIDFKAHSNDEKSMILSSSAPQLEDIVNPVVRRAVSQTIKVVNAIIREQGHSPVYINIELARELSKSFDERRKIEKSMSENAEKNQRIVERLQNELGVLYPTGMDIVKFKLWQEQDGVCPYSQTYMDISRLFEPGYVDVDHIIPYSICFDDSYNNKVLTLSSENRQKGNKIPMQYLSGKKKDDFQVWVNTNIKNSNKKQRLLKAELKDEDINGFKSRNLNDTKYLSRVLYNYINDTLAFEEFSNGGKKHVTAVNGAATSYIRKRWGIAKIREDGDLHHAVDAAVIACTTNGMIRKISEYSKRREIENEDNSFPLPYQCFRNELEARTDNNAKQSVIDRKLPNYTEIDIENVKSCFVSRMPNHKVTGAAHLDTIRSGREQGYTISKVALSSLKLDKDGQIANYYNPSSDTLLYNALKSRLEQFGGDGKSAFPQDFVFRKPTSTGKLGPIVKKVKIIEKSTLNVTVRGGNGVAANGDMVRIDIFKPENDGYYFVPIYVSDTVKEKLPSLACRAGGQEWKPMNDDDFIFSLYPNDLIKVTSKKDIKLTVTNKGSSLQKEIFRNNEMFYFCGADISTASIKIESHDGAYFVRGLGIKSLLSLEKYTVDVLGNYHKVVKEKRMTFK